MTVQAPPIVVGVTGSHASAVALRWAAEQARRTGCVVEAVTVTPAADTHDAADQVGAVALDFPDVRIRRREVVGSLGPGLVRAAQGAAMLVLGAGSAGPVARTLLGSVGGYCVAEAECPVVIMPRAAVTAGAPDADGPDAAMFTPML